jgi:hypothetical protein
MAITVTNIEITIVAMNFDLSLMVSVPSQVNIALTKATCGADAPTQNDDEHIRGVL